MMEAAKLVCEFNNNIIDITYISLNRLIDLEVRVKYLEEENQKLKNQPQGNIFFGNVFLLVLLVKLVKMDSLW